VVAPPRRVRARSEVTPARTFDHAFFVVSSLLFATSVTLTIAWCASMSAMRGMPMPGGWTMAMAWMRMPGQTWPGAAGSFLGMWVVMMVAMMLPSLIPTLRRYRQVVPARGETDRELLTALVCAGYFLVWSAFGLAAFLLGIAVAAVEMQRPQVARAVPIAVAVIVLIAGGFQFTRWKTHHLRCFRDAPGRDMEMSADARTAWRHGVRLGLRCAQCCANLMAILLVIGVMDVDVMAVIASAITTERLASNGEGAARAIGVVIIGAGGFLFASAMRFSL